MGDWNFSWPPVCLPNELADPFAEPDSYSADVEEDEAAGNAGGEADAGKAR